eukprot:6212446-Pleurochrysis_carterae.AAC.2
MALLRLIPTRVSDQLRGHEALRLKSERPVRRNAQAFQCGLTSHSADGSSVYQSASADALITSY